MMYTLRYTYKPVLAALLAATAVAALGAFNTVLGPWYYALQKPAWQPPDWLFGPAWTLIFALTALSGILFWRHEPRHAPRMQALTAFVVNGVFNVAWTVLFFRLQHPLWALYEVPLLWLSIIGVMVSVRRASRLAAVLLLPYLAWVSFASVLNWKIGSSMAAELPLQSGFASGSVVIWIVALLAVEGGVLLWVRHRGRLSFGALELFATLGAGAGLLLALRSALRGEPWQSTALWLALGGVAHAIDLSHRVRRLRVGQRNF